MGASPFLWIQGDPFPTPTDAQLERAGRTRAQHDAEVQRIIAAWHGSLARIKGGAMRVQIDRPGLTHIDFSDEPFWDAMPPDVRAGKLKTIADTRAWVRAFFDGAVRGEWDDLEQLAGEESRSEVTVHVLEKMWP